MADRVIRHFERMRAPRAKRIAIHWPEGARDLAPSTFGAVFEGDTVTASAQFDRPAISGDVTLEIETDGGDVFRQQLAMTPPRESADRVSTVARLAASARLKELDHRAGLDQAIRYRLVSPWTNWLVVAARPDGEKALDIPALRKVPQTLAAGWGGVGALASRLSADLMPALSAEYSRREAGASEVAEIARSSMEGLTEMESDLARLFLQADDLNRGVETVTGEVRRAVESHQKHAQQAERELSAMESQLGDLRSAIDSLQDRANVLRRRIGEMEDRANDLLGATDRAVETGVLESHLRDAIYQQLLQRLADFRALLVQIEELLVRLQEGRKRLAHLQEVAREWAEVIMRYRHLAGNWR
jgi:hypothetical protein